MKSDSEMNAKAGLINAVLTLAVGFHPRSSMELLDALLPFTWRRAVDRRSL